MEWLKVANKSVKLGLLVHNTCDKLLPNEGKVGTYKELRDAGSVSDQITAHHIPSNKHMRQHGVPTDDGIAINMEHYTQGNPQGFPTNTGRHPDTFTYGNANKYGGGDVNMSPRDALAAGIRDARKIYARDGLYNAEIRKALQEVIQKNKVAHPQIFRK
jgi:hypothetical protein